MPIRDLLERRKMVQSVGKAGSSNSVKADDAKPGKRVTRSQTRAPLRDENHEAGGAFGGANLDLQHKKRRVFEDGGNSENILAGTKRLKEDKKKGFNKIKKPEKKENGHSERRFRRIAFKSKSKAFEVEIPKPLSPRKQDSKWDLTDLTLCINNILPRVPQCVEDIDSRQDNYSYAPEYAMDIMQYLMNQELKFQFRSDYMDTMSEINPAMRAVLVDWLIQVQNHLILNDETLQLAVTMIDKFLMQRMVPLVKLQLVGVTCLLIAAKYIERFTPELSQLVHLTDNTYTESEILRMERVVLDVLKFQLSLPLPADFLHRFIQAASGNSKMLHLCQYMLDLCLTDIVSLGYPPSKKAAASIYLARQLLFLHNEEGEDDIESKTELDIGSTDQRNEEVWTETLHYFTTYTEKELIGVISRIAKLLVKAKKAKIQVNRQVH